MNQTMICLYRENADRPGIYDFAKGQAPPPVHYFRISEPRDLRFRKQGAVLMLESWTDGDKKMFTGLRRLYTNVYYGDHINAKGKRSLFCLVQEGDTYQLHYFPGQCPRSKRKCGEFLERYFRPELFTAGNG